MQSIEVTSAHDAKRAKMAQYTGIPKTLTFAERL